MSIETYNNYIKNDTYFTNSKIQDYYVEHNFCFIMLNAAVKSLKKSSISTQDVSHVASCLRMVFERGEWRLQNDMKKDIELMGKLGFTPLQKIIRDCNIF